MQVNLGKFDINGRCGYVLKSRVYIDEHKEFNPFDQLPISEVISLDVNVAILAGYVSAYSVLIDNYLIHQCLRGACDCLPGQSFSTTSLSVCTAFDSILVVRISSPLWRLCLLACLTMGINDVVKRFAPVEERVCILPGTRTTILARRTYVWCGDDGSGCDSHLCDP